MTSHAIPGPWAEAAACRGQTNAMAMPDSHNGRGRTYNTGPGRRHVRDAKTICAHCPAQTPCRQWALTVPDPAIGMIAGGLTPDERARTRRKDRAE